MFTNLLKTGNTVYPDLSTQLPRKDGYWALHQHCEMLKLLIGVQRYFHVFFNTDGLQTSLFQNKKEKMLCYVNHSLDVVLLNLSFFPLMHLSV